MLPDENGNEITRKLRKAPETKKLPVIMVTAKTGEFDLVKGIEDGADDYIKKPFSVMELISRVKAMLRRNQAEEIKELKLDELVENNEKHEVSIEGKVIELTFKEYELLSTFIINKGIVLSRGNIMDQVWGTDYEGESRTIDMHIKTLRQKLQVLHRVPLVIGNERQRSNVVSPYGWRYGMADARTNGGIESG